MIFSMTGYGESQFTYKGNAIKVELRSLNGKTIDARLRLPNRYKSQEIKLRKLVLDTIIRGKIDFVVNISQVGDNGSQLNIPLIKQYINELRTVQEEENLGETDLLSAVLSIPSIFDQGEDKAEEEEIGLLFNAVKEALKKIINYRAVEGESMKVDLINRIHAIQEEHEKVAGFIDQRNKAIEERIKTNLNQAPGVKSIDENRFEQEIIYYLDKLDINEETVRLDQNCKYFLEVVNLENEVKGKKLGFIAQEIGREINTLGSKAQHADIQRLVVKMKDELEKMKEQLANIM